MGERYLLWTMTAVLAEVLIVQGSAPGGGGSLRQGSRGDSSRRHRVAGAHPQRAGALRLVAGRVEEAAARDARRHGTLNGAEAATMVANVAVVSARVAGARSDRTVPTAS